MVKNFNPNWYSCSLRTASVRPVIVFEKVGIHLRLGRLEFDCQVLMTDIVNETILGVDIMNMYGFIVDFKTMES